MAILYWLSVFSLIGLQLVIAFLLLASTKDVSQFLLVPFLRRPLTSVVKLLHS